MFTLTNQIQSVIRVRKSYYCEASKIGSESIQLWIGECLLALIHTFNVNTKIFVVLFRLICE